MVNEPVVLISQHVVLIVRWNIKRSY